MIRQDRLERGPGGVEPEPLARLLQRLDGREVGPIVATGVCQAFSTKLSITFFSPALSKETVSLLPSTKRTAP